MVDVTALKRRSAAFYASGQVAKALAVDAEIARLRGAAFEPEPAPADGEDPSPVEVAVADLGDVEAAAAVRRGPGRPRKER